MTEAVRSGVAARLDQLAKRYELAASARERLAILLEQLQDRHAPTTVQDPCRAVETHVSDALTGLEVEQLRRAERIADLGAGAGIPGLVLAAALSRTHVVLVESVGRKAAYIDRVAAAMGLDNAEIVTARAESWQQGIGSCDVVTARAVAPLPILVEYAAPLLRIGGALVAWKGDPESAEREDGDHAARVLGMSAAEPLAVSPQRGADYRSLYLYRKLTETPPGYPRRPGIARKRPLRAPR
jgi:16S rRNA (guanine527-N7)-methyltransferase